MRRTGLHRPTVRGATVVALSMSLVMVGPSSAVTVSNIDMYAPGATLVGEDAQVPPARCGPGSSPERGVQGQIPLEDRLGGRSQGGYACNLVLLGSHQGEGAGWSNAWYGHCDYYSTKTSPDPSRWPNGSGNGQKSPGVQVIDVSDPRRPKLTANLNTPAMNGPWESLKANQKRGLLAAVGGFGSDGQGPLYFDVYDVKKDCAHPTLLASVPINTAAGHEGNFAPDGLTYYTGYLNNTAIDLTDPRNPKPIAVLAASGHGHSLSADGKTLYGCSNPRPDMAVAAATSGGIGSVMGIWDVSAIQARSPAPAAIELGTVAWTDGGLCQHPIAVTYRGKPYIVAVDEGGGNRAGSLATGVPAGAARLIDVSNPAAARIVSVLRLAIQTPKHAEANQRDLADGRGSQFGYVAHYCAVDRPADPTALACGYFQSGIRVFDIRDPFRPREIAYFIPPAQAQKVGKLPGSQRGGGPVDLCASQVHFHRGSDGRWQLWGQCMDNGFMVLQFTNRAYPLRGR